MMERPEYRLRVLAGFFLIEKFKVQSSRTVIKPFMSFLIICGNLRELVLSIKHKLAQMAINYQKFFCSSRRQQFSILNFQFSILNSQFSIFNSKKAPTLLKNSSLLTTYRLNQLLYTKYATEKKWSLSVLSQMRATVATTEGEKHEKCWRRTVFDLILQCKTNKTTII